MSGFVRRVRTCRLRVGAAPWPFARAHAAAIRAHWAKRQAENPAFFNGVIHILHRHSLADGVFDGELLRTDFQSYLYWRETGYPGAGLYDAFGSALLRSSDGKILLGRQAPGNINSGLTYLPGGFIDKRDVRPDLSIDLAGSIEREVSEELGLPPATFTARPGAIVTFAGPLISIAIDHVSHLTSDRLLSQARRHIASEREPELEDVVAVAGVADLQSLAMPDYARMLLTALFSGEVG
jgi:8-oxo-dGTP pyrophosphatase MutT (NUDIX family)